MKRILALVLVFSLTLCAALPVMAQATSGGGIDISAATPDISEVPEDGSTAEGGGPDDSGGTEETSPPATPTQPDAPEVTDLPEGIDLEDTVQSILPDGGVIMPMSGWVGEDSEFFTKIRILVSDSETGQPIQGAVYALYRADGTFVQYLTTDYYGTATSDDVSVYYDYYLEEYSTPDGFRPNTERKDIILSEECAPSRVDVYAEYDPIYGNIKVIKTDEDGHAMSGVSFDVYRYDDWSYMETITTGWDGAAETGSLRYGWYELVEDTPEGYSGSGSYSAFVEYDGETVEVEITNYYARGSLRIYKYGADGRAIQGAVFSIYRIPRYEVNAVSLQANDLDGEWLMDITTNASGYAYAYDLLAGYDYYAIEKSVPEPYRLDTETVHEFTISYSGQYVYLDVENEIDGDPGTVTVVKTDDSANPLDGVVFGLFRVWDNKRLETLTTSNGGQAQSGPLVPGDYYLIEETGVEGYTPVTGQIPFTIDGSGAAVVKTVVNPKIRVFGKVEVEKVDDAGNPIPGVTFGIYCVAADKLLGELVTGEDGTDTSGVLNAGDYYLLERGCEAVEGYIVSTERHPFTIDTNGEIVRVTVVNPRITGQIRVIKTGDGSEPLPGVVFGIFKDGQKIEELTTGEDGTATSGALYYGSGYELRELSTVDGYELIDTSIPFSILEQDVVLDIPVTNPLILGGITVIKISEPEAQEAQIVLYSEDGGDDGLIYLDGAVFGLYNAQGQKIAELVTENGRATYTGLPVGLYYLLELKAPDFHVLSGDMIAFRIDEQGQVVEKVVTNAKGYGVLEVVKTGENDEPLAGVSFDVFLASTDEKVGEIVTGEDGRDALELPLGRYYLVETATVEPYLLLDGPVSIALTEDGATVELPIINQKAPVENGTVRLIKTDEDGGNKLPGAVFGIYREADLMLVGEIVTGSEGEAVSQPLPPGDYYLYEHRAPSGFAKSEASYHFSLAPGETYEVTATNTALPTDTGLVEIIKKSESDGALLQNAVFGVFTAEGDVKVGELTTGKDGAATLEISGGDFYLLELEAPAGFRVSAEKTYFTIAAGDTKTFTLYNKPEDEPEDDHNLVIIKSAAGTGERLEGAVFGVYRDGSSTKIAELTTSEYGIASMTLASGDYYLRELRAPRGGYVAEKNAIPFTITPDGAVVKIEVSNTKGVGTLRLTKTGTDGKAVAGAVFTVYDWNGRRVTDITTGGDGTAVYELPAAPYYVVEKSVPSPYVLSSEEHVFTIEAGKRTDLKVVNEVEKTPAPTSTTPAQPSDPGPSTGITIPKTGAGLPVMRYMLQALCLVVAAVSSGMLYRLRKRERQTQA